MKISFDLDDTLIPTTYNFKTEKRNFLQKLLRIEELRTGTKEVFEFLRDKGHHVGIYTTSYRNKTKILFYLWSYGVRADFIINEQVNSKKLKNLGISSSKFPPAFKINLHLDDSKGVELEGRKFNFDVLLIEELEKNWIEKIKEYVI